MALGSHFTDLNNPRRYPFIHMGGVKQCEVNFLLKEISGSPNGLEPGTPWTRVVRPTTGLFCSYYWTLLCGLREPTGDAGDNVERKELVMSSDVVLNVSKGSMDPWKQIELRLGLGILTGSKLILRILDRMSYSLSYNELKILEFAYSR